MVSEIKVIDKVKKMKPHLVILGAGASKAAFPEGDKNNKELPVMDDFIEVLGLKGIVENLNLETDSDNFEDIYSELYAKDKYQNELNQIEEKVFNYFSDLRLPEDTTIYDYLIISLRKKDAIATFNWDPLLIQAYQRVKSITEKLPELIFLHGNVWMGICKEHKIATIRGYGCPECREELEKVKLLYPIKEKDYEEDDYIRSQWERVRAYLKDAFSITIFGYSAPKSDQAAINLFKEAWGDIEERRFEEIEIIDIKSRKELRETWNDFIHTHHYRTHKSYFESQIALFPRRTIEAYYETLIKARFVDDHKIPDNISFSKLKDEIKKLLKHEN